MKKLYYLIVLALILGLVLTGCSLLSNVGQVPTSEQSGITYLTKNSNGELFTTDLKAGQNTVVGEVQVWNDTENLHITYVIDAPGWYLTETHLHVACDDNPIPVNGKGNPIPGHFDYGSEHEVSENVTVKEFTIPLEDISCCNLDIAAHAVVIEQLTDGGCADSVYDYDQGTQKGGGPGSIGSGRNDPEDALRSIDNSFFSLGFVDAESGGWIILEFEDYVGTCLTVVEQSPGTGYQGGVGYPLEQAEVYVSTESDNPTDWTYLGMANNRIAVGSETGQSHENVFYLEECIKFVKIVDQTDPTLHSSNADAFDLDAVCGGPCYQEETETAWGDGYRFVDQGNWATYFNYIKVVGPDVFFSDGLPVLSGQLITDGDNLILEVTADPMALSGNNAYMAWLIYTGDKNPESFAGPWDDTYLLNDNWYSAGPQGNVKWGIGEDSTHPWSNQGDLPSGVELDYEEDGNIGKWTMTIPYGTITAESGDEIRYMVQARYQDTGTGGKFLNQSHGNIGFNPLYFSENFQTVCLN